MTDPAFAADVQRRLAAADKLVEHDSGWLRWYFAAFGAAAAAMALAVGLLPAPIGVILGLTGWAATMAVISSWARTGGSRGLVPRGFLRRNAIIVSVWTVTFAAVLVIGTVGHLHGVLWWWIPGAVLLAAPPLAAAVRSPARA